MNNPTELQSSPENNPAESEENLKDRKNPIRKKGGFFIIILLFAGLIFFSRHEAIVTIDCTPEIIAPLTARLKLLPKNPMSLC
jgi:hypothetical protein